MMLFERLTRQACRVPKLPSCETYRHFWGWLNAIFNKVDHERIQAVGPDRAASEWLLRCGAHVRFQGLDKWQQDYNRLPTGPLGRYKIQAIDATESCIMHMGFDYLAFPSAVLQMAWSRWRRSSFASVCTSRTSACGGSARCRTCRGACGACGSFPVGTSRIQASSPSISSAIWSICS
ncbi:ATP synthase subunit s, mitochondrial isoform X2 [Paroedura picta]|uniref:ATP synthase subunit s, mitochondrial isoform X2 n=1 Tax=Paroedura picta TaxID=143630 RepID=UPI004056416E